MTKYRSKKVRNYDEEKRREEAQGSYVEILRSSSYHGSLNIYGDFSV